MPELPEVETTLRGIQPHILNNEIEKIEVRQPHLRWPVPTEEIIKCLKGNYFSKTFGVYLASSMTYLVFWN